MEGKIKISVLDTLCLILDIQAELQKRKLDKQVLASGKDTRERELFVYCV